MKNIPKRSIIILTIALAAFIFLWVYINDTLQKSRAAQDQVTVNFVPDQASNNVDQEYLTFITIQAADTQKISGVDLTISSTGGLQITGIDNPVPVDTNDPNFFTEISQNVNTQSARIASVAQKPDAQLPQAVKIAVRYKVTQGGGGKIIVNQAKTQFTGNTQAGTFGLGQVGDFSGTPGTTASTNTPTQTPSNSEGPTASVDGPASGALNTPLSYTATGTDQGGNLSRVEIYVSPTSQQSWTLLKNCVFASSTTHSCTTDWTPTTAGNYYIVTNAYTTNGLKCSGNPFVTYPYQDFLSCGSGSSKTVSIDSSTLSPTQAPISTVSVPAGSSAGPTNLHTQLTSSNQIQLTWDAWVPSNGSSVFEYTIQRNGVTIGTSKQSNFTDTLTSSGTYDYNIGATDTSGNYAQNSSTVSVTYNIATAPSPAPTQAPIATLIVLTVAPTTQPSARVCQKNHGDANCNFSIDVFDFEIWRKEFTGELVGTQADFNSDNKVDILDFEIWRSNYFDQNLPL